MFYKIIFGDLIFMTLDVLKTLIEHTGLPEHLISSELERLLKKAGLSKEDVTLDHIRELLALELQDVILKAKNQQE